MSPQRVAILGSMCPPEDPGYAEPPIDSVEAEPLPSGGNAAAPRPAQRAFATLLEVAEVLLLMAVIFLSIRTAAQNFRVEGLSMEPSFYNGDYVLVDKVAYARIDLRTVHRVLPFVSPGSDPTRYIFGGPQRGDVIVFHPPTADSAKDYIKRVIGLPGDTVAVRNGAVYVNGVALQERYIRERPLYTAPPTVVPPGTVYVLGDNRNESQDSHDFGPVPLQNIVGRAELVFLPFSHIGLAPNHHLAAPAPATAAAR